MHLHASTQIASSTLFLAILALGACKPSEELDPDAAPPLDDRPRTSKLAPAKAKQVVTGILHSCALTTEGSVRCWGNHFDGALGIGAGAPEDSPDFNMDRYMASQVVGLTSGVVQISSDGVAAFTCALLDTGKVRCWGMNDYGQIGDTRRLFEREPVEIPGVDDATQIDVGGRHVCALVSGGKIKCWGGGGSGQLGNDDNMDSPTPVEVVGMEGASAVSAGRLHTCALKDGGVWCWGENVSGAVGYPDSSTLFVPYQVPSLTSGVAQLSLGDDFSCARMQNGGVRCWGRNDYSQLGARTTMPYKSHTPVDVGLTGVTWLSTGRIEGAAVTNGKILHWGYEDLRQGYQLHETPIEGPAIAGIDQISVGYMHKCATTKDGAVSCWGDNGAGQAGFFDSYELLPHLEQPTPVDSLP